MNNKSNRKIKIAAILLTALLLFTCFTTACQPTPDQSVVIQKDLEKMIEKAVGETDSTDTASTLKEKLELPETYTLQRDSVKGYLHLNVNANFYVPDVDKIPVQKVSIRPITQDETDILVDVLMKGQPIFTMDTSQKVQLTKSQLEGILIETQKELATGENVGMTKDELEAKIENLQEQIQKAPETLQDMKVVESDGKLLYCKDPETGTEYEGLDVQADLGGDSFAWLEIVNDTDSRRIFVDFMQRVDVVEDLTITQEQAIQTATDLVNQLGLADVMVLDTVLLNKDFQTYNLSFLRQINGVRLYNREGAGANQTDEGSDYAAPWDFEELYMEINDLWNCQFPMDISIRIGRYRHRRL